LITTARKTKDFKMVSVKKKSEREFLVTIEEKSSSPEHTVTVDDDYYQNLTVGKTTKEELIKRSFEFLFEREPKESILSKFNLRIIKKYFLEYEQKISK
jgi:hypothetical protein